MELQISHVSNNNDSRRGGRGRGGEKILIENEFLYVCGFVCVYMCVCYAVVLA